MMTFFAGITQIVKGIKVLDSEMNLEIIDYSARLIVRRR